MNENLSSQHEFDLKCKQLSRKWHPDKYIKNLDLGNQRQKKSSWRYSQHAILFLKIELTK